MLYVHNTKPSSRNPDFTRLNTNEGKRSTMASDEGTRRQAIKVDDSKTAVVWLADKVILPIENTYGKVSIGTMIYFFTVDFTLLVRPHSLKPRVLQKLHFQMWWK